MNYKYEVIHRNENFKIDDVFTDWITSSSIAKAREEIEKVYPYMEGYTCRIIT